MDKSAKVEQLRKERAQAVRMGDYETLEWCDNELAALGVAS